MSKSDVPPETEDMEDKEEDQDLALKDKKTKARLRTRGPYRKAHADWLKPSGTFRRAFCLLSLNSICVIFGITCGVSGHSHLILYRSKLGDRSNASAVLQHSGKSIWRENKNAKG